jgi:glycosyltransferase involved in cell wall biosynthesis
LGLKLLRLFVPKLKFKVVSIGHGGSGIERQQVSVGPDAHVTLSSFSEGILRGASKRKVLIRKIPNMVQTHLFSAQTFRNFKKEIPVVLTVAAGVPYKNVDLAMRATARAGFKMIWCGDGPLRQELLELASTLFRPGFFLWTKVAPHEMVNIYSSADVFTLGSEADQEAYGLVYLEAMASGLRCVATDDAIRREACGEDAEYVNPRDFRQYAEALERVWSITKAKGPISWDPGPHSPEAVALSFSGLFREMVENEV